jgi:exosortase
MATQQADRIPSTHRLVLPAAGLFLLGFLFWCYWTTLADMSERWAGDPMYSHGYLVPLFALVLLWLRRAQCPQTGLRPNWWGLALVAAALLLRLAGACFYYPFLDQVSLLPCLAGIALLAAGWPALRFAWPAIAYLAFMIPLPYSVAMALSGPMQTFATNASVFVLQVLGQPALAEGNVILLNEVELKIVAACSGLSMLVVFFALSTAVALVVRKPLWEKIVIGASAAPIALLANIMRITMTALLYELVDAELARSLFHDLAGWMMMPIALGLLGLELLFLKHLFLEPVASVGAARLQSERRWWQPPSRIRQKKPVLPAPAPSRRRSLARR